MERSWGMESDKPVLQSRVCFYLNWSQPQIKKFKAELKNPEEFNVVDLYLVSIARNFSSWQKINIPAM